MKLFQNRLQAVIPFYHSFFSLLIRAVLSALQRPIPKPRFILLFIIINFTFVKSIMAQSPASENWSKPNLLGWDSVWKYQPGPAMPEYFNRDFNDEKWESVQYRFLDTIMPGTPSFKQTGSFRRTFFVPDSLKGKQVDLFFSQFGATEIYFDGRLVYRKGQINGSIGNYVVVQHTVPLQLDSLPWHVLSIYYASTISRHLADVYSLRGFGITLVAARPKDGDDNDTYHHMLVSFGIIAGFALFFWFVFAFYPGRIESLISAVMLTNFSLIFLGSLLRDVNDPSLFRFIIGEKLWEIGFSGTYGFLLLYIYAVYYKRLKRYNRLAILLIVISYVFIIAETSFWFMVSIVFLGLYIIESWRMVIKGLIRRKTGFWILAIGLFLSIVGTLTTIFNVFGFFPGYLTPTQTILGVATDLCFPLTLALHLAWEFGSANRDLRKKLKQVNELSEKSIAQELEKQQILSSQNETLERQVHERTDELEQSIVELKSAQAQLIQSEKMASLGQLTAGIAHEIQNPLNFVNNFSEINNELIEEANREMESGKPEATKELLNDIYRNNEKIVLHGKRADAIVKGMLQHSRKSSGEKEPVDINALADEYLRLAYHGARAKDNTFNVTLKTDFDARIAPINVSRQDIGRVLLNLYNNALYALKMSTALKKENYEPTLTLITKQDDGKVFIRVKDNGIGISQSIIDKIFQPFFTTKPTGEGTGLGLSLSYDIVKAQDGEIKVNSIEGEFTEFVVILK